MALEFSVQSLNRLFVLLVPFLVISLASSAVAADQDRAAVIQTAQKYLIHGLVEHKPDLVPLSKNCWRIEQGTNTGRSGQEIKKRLLREEYKLITGISDQRWLVEGEEAVVFYNLHVSSSDKPVLIAERFRVVNHQIEEIEALFYRPQP